MDMGSASTASPTAMAMPTSTAASSMDMSMGGSGCKISVRLTQYPGRAVELCCADRRLSDALELEHSRRM